jgi:hypothetical protein
MTKSMTIISHKKKILSLPRFGTLSIVTKQKKNYDRNLSQKKMKTYIYTSVRHMHSKTMKQWQE